MRGNYSMLEMKTAKSASLNIYDFQLATYHANRDKKVKDRTCQFCWVWWYSPLGRWHSRQTHPSINMIFKCTLWQKIMEFKNVFMLTICTGQNKLGGCNDGSITKFVIHHSMHNLKLRTVQISKCRVSTLPEEWWRKLARARSKALGWYL
jgi:hypothetical protein